MTDDGDRSNLLGALTRDQRISIGVGESSRLGWYRAQVLSHDVSTGRLVVRCFMDRPADQPLEPGERVVVAVQPRSDTMHSAPMDVEESTGGAEAVVTLRMAGAWQREDERRHHVRVPLMLPITRARRWSEGAWRELNGVLVDLSSRGLGLKLDREVRPGDRLQLDIPLADGLPVWRVTVEMRHVRSARRPDGEWHAGGQFRNISTVEHERVIRFIFAELRGRRS